VLHRHIVALFKKGALIVDITARSDLLLSGACVVQRILTLWLETPVTRVKNDRLFQCHVPWLTVGLGSGAALFGKLAVGVLTGTGLVNFE